MEMLRHSFPRKAGTHIPEACVYGTMGPRFRGDDWKGSVTE
jgi:hypothetical protein